MGPCIIKAQDIGLFEQYNGTYDFTLIGNTLNSEENGALALCEITTSSSATLNLSAGDTVEAAYLYWAGSGAGDLEIQLNGTIIASERTYNLIRNSLIYFSAFADITDFIREQGNGLYTVSDFDLTDVVPDYCFNATNFGGWSILLILRNDSYPIRQLNVYDGLQSVPNAINISLTNLNVIDTEGSRIGFLAWEGDAGIAVNESLKINGNLIGNPPLNPTNNAFNGTNSFTGASNLYNMDIDYYPLEGNIDIGDTEAQIQLTSGQDFVMVNVIITLLSNKLPDATLKLLTTVVNCNDRRITGTYEVANLTSTDVLPSGVSVRFYADDLLLFEDFTETVVPIGTSITLDYSLDIPDEVADEFKLRIVIDENNAVLELDNTNNTDEQNINLLNSPPLPPLDPLIECDLGFNRAIFNLEELDLQLSENLTFVGFYENTSDAEANVSPIVNTRAYLNMSDPQEIYYTVQDENCYALGIILLTTENCPPTIPQGFSPNGDRINEEFNIAGLKDIFENYELRIYNRYGMLVFRGNNDLPNWDGTSSAGLGFSGTLPVGTYFYVLELNDPNYSVQTGWVYLNR